MYNFVLVMVCFRFCKIVFVCKLLKFVELPNYMCYGEIINSLFNVSVLIFINTIAEL
jgi:hypothetical protein